ncbi:hypothetical protein KIN20_036300 [Parelaphostrongylus tenuis]|uniref:Uncharacterized protein n=1 Tax=Parelaphostrongylus tenuis TaxID=148309 RepID=A0AAD5WL41_PARTN|nr:hypothetical protein KIN20_036300 [Parelaphostrongylus tenuis]
MVTSGCQGILYAQPAIYHFEYVLGSAQLEDGPSNYLTAVLSTLDFLIDCLQLNGGQGLIAKGIVFLRMHVHFPCMTVTQKVKSTEKFTSATRTTHSPGIGELIIYRY